MKSAVGSKSKIKAKGGQLNEKILVTLQERFAKKCVEEIEHSVFPGFRSNGKTDRRFKEENYEVIMERMFNEDNEEINEEEEEDKDVDEKKNFSPSDTPDEFTKESEWVIPEDTNEICTLLINYCRKQYKVPPQSKFKIYIGQYMRMPPTKIDPPTPDTINRIIFNLKNNDLYRLEPGPMTLNFSTKNDDGKAKSDIEKKLDEPLESRTIFLEAGKSFPMGPYKQSNYYVKLNPGSKIIIPPKVQARVSIRGQNTQYKIKPIRYARITIVVDIKVSTDMVEKITRETIKKMEENKDMVDDMAKKIRESDMDVADLMKNANSMGNDQGKKKRRRRRRRKKAVTEDDNEDEELNSMIKDLETQNEKKEENKKKRKDERESGVNEKEVNDEDDELNSMM